MRELGNLNEFVPLSHPLGRGTAGQKESGGTSCGTKAGQVSLKALAIAKIGGTVRGTKAGQEEEILSHGITQGGTNLSHVFERNRQVLAGQNPASSSAGNVLPGYSKWCADWWQGCFACPDFMPEKVRFCRRWNRAAHGVDVVEVCQPTSRQDTDLAWWNRRRYR